VLKIIDATFLTTAVAPGSYPANSLPEVAVVGRSNVGKSSMINALAARRKLARTSKTPGRTRALNFFRIELDQDGSRRQVCLVDLPGYGFAKVSKAEHQHWEEMVSTYLHQRDPLRLVIGLVDAEVGATPADEQMLSYVRAAGRPILLVATKVDRLSKAKVKPKLLALSRQLDLPVDRIFAFSATLRTGVDEVWRALLDRIC
jgi:GTP-binding protein